MSRCSSLVSCLQRIDELVNRFSWNQPATADLDRLNLPGPDKSIKGRTAKSYGLAAIVDVQ